MENEWKCSERLFQMTDAETLKHRLPSSVAFLGTVRSPRSAKTGTGSVREIRRWYADVPWKYADRYLERKGKEVYLYSAFYILCISQSAQAWITQFYPQIHHACLSFVCVHQMAPPITEVRHI